MSLEIFIWIDSHHHEEDIDDDGVHDGQLAFDVLLKSYLLIYHLKSNLSTKRIRDIPIPDDDNDDDNDDDVHLHLLILHDSDL
jgi:hypothetical protein